MMAQTVTRMIRPQWEALNTAYEPWLSIERMLFLDQTKTRYVVATIPSADDLSWQWAFDFDHEHMLVHVAVANFYSLDTARNALLWVMWQSDKLFKTGGITDMLTDDEFIRTTYWSIEK